MRIKWIKRQSDNEETSVQDDGDVTLEQSNIATPNLDTTSDSVPASTIDGTPPLAALTSTDSFSPQTHHSTRIAVIAGLAIICVSCSVVLAYVAWRCRHHMKRRKAERQAHISDYFNQSHPLRRSREAEECMSSTTKNDFRSDMHLFIEDLPSRQSWTTSARSSSGGAVKEDGTYTHRPLSFASALTCIKDTYSLDASMHLQTLPNAFRASPTARTQLHINTSSLTELSNRDADRLSRAIAQSPVTSAMLTESFDVRATLRGQDLQRPNDEGEKTNKSFDWNRCKFDEEEEEAMWLPSIDRSSCHQHQRSTSEPITSLPMPIAMPQLLNRRSCPLDNPLLMPLRTELAHSDDSPVTSFTSDVTLSSNGASSTYVYSLPGTPTTLVRSPYDCEIDKFFVHRTLQRNDSQGTLDVLTDKLITVCPPSANEKGILRSSSYVQRLPSIYSHTSLARSASGSSRRPLSNMSPLSLSTSLHAEF